MSTLQTAQWETSRQIHHFGVRLHVRHKSLKMPLVFHFKPVVFRQTRMRIFIQGCVYIFVHVYIHGGGNCGCRCECMNTCMYMNLCMYVCGMVAVYVCAWLCAHVYTCASTPSLGIPTELAFFSRQIYLFLTAHNYSLFIKITFPPF